MTLVLHGYPISANTHRVRLMLSLLGLSWRDELVDLVRGQQRGATFRQVNPAGQVPALVDGALTLWDSHAILAWLAQTHGGPDWWPASGAELAAVLQWMFFDANEIHNGIGYARNHHAFGVGCDYEAAADRGRAALAVLDQRLAANAWLALDRPSLADVACYPMVAVADEAGLETAPYPAVGRWLARLATLPGFMPMPRRR
jgi:glutathione S-transferase